MALHSLLLCNDPETLRLVRSILSDLGIGVDLCPEPGPMMEKLARKKYEVVIMDCKATPRVAELLAELRASKSNRTSITYLIGHEAQDLDSALEQGADFVLPRPLVLGDAWRALRTARNLMEREQRRYYRARTDMPVHLLLGNAEEIRASAKNLSAGGMSVLCPQPLLAREIIGVRFIVPGRQTLIEADAEIAWADDEGRAGICFLQMPNEAQDLLDRWVAERVEEHEFAFVSVTPSGKRLGAARFPNPGLPEPSPGY
ncbi:MAG TPA: PilZ domain-containing protein [Terriglobales bacterium]|jgi:CheY-like chemotaxis protein|nr:PilZ domain-containing protein [Terriglobales bacterium]